MKWTGDKGCKILRIRYKVKHKVSRFGKGFMEITDRKTKRVRIPGKLIKWSKGTFVTRWGDRVFGVKIIYEKPVNRSNRFGKIKKIKYTKIVKIPKHAKNIVVELP